MSEQYDFDEIVERRNTESNKWDKYQGRDILPMWVADSDFRAAPAITKAMHQRLEHDVFGYTHVSDELRAVVVARLQRLYQWEIAPEWLVFWPGVVSSLHMISRNLGEAGDSVYTADVIYQHIPEVADFNARVNCPVPMTLQDDRMIIDLDWLAAQKSKPGQMMVFCNPQNPGGAIYRKAELERLAEIAEQQDLIICSDEIHCDLILDTDKQHIPIASLNDDIAKRSITLMGPSKSFNLAGLGCCFAIIPDRSLRNKMINAGHGSMPWVNIFGLRATQAAYQSGDEWLRQQMVYLAGNRDLLYDEINRIPGLKMDRTEATYLAWIDIGELNLDDPMAFFENAGVGFSPGEQFGDKRFMRLNFACPRSRVQMAIERIRSAVEALV